MVEVRSESAAQVASAEGYLSLRHALIAQAADWAAVSAVDGLPAGLRDQDLIRHIRHKKLLPEAQLICAMAAYYDFSILDLERYPPPHIVQGVLCPRFMLAHNMVIWRGFHRSFVIGISNPANIPAIRASLSKKGFIALFVLASEDEIRHHLLRLHRRTLSHLANKQAPVFCASQAVLAGLSTMHLIGGVAILAACAYVMPRVVANVIMLVLTFGLLAILCLRLCAAISSWRAHKEAPPLIPQADHALPVISLILPILREERVLKRLIRNIEALNYPKDKLDVLIVFEASDPTMRHWLENWPLPPHFQTVEVPRDVLQTKPRALSYALPFARGTLIGVYDAEDRPDPHQLHHVAQFFAQAPKRVAACQAVLDFDAPHRSLISRWFTIEYAVLFRVILPGLARLRFPILLGGTSFFIRRNVLDEIGAWDAYNVTEDAELGLRVARSGYEIGWVNTTTHEEVNFRIWPWIRQRSRWLKGFMITWAAQMMFARKSMSDFGVVNFVIMNVLLLAAMGVALTGLIAWPLWVLTFAHNAPLTAIFHPLILKSLIVVMITSELLTMIYGVVAVRRRDFGGQRLWPFVLLMPLYWPFGVAAGIKALWEIFTRPTYWDKTEHGVLNQEEDPCHLPSSSEPP